MQAFHALLIWLLSNSFDNSEHGKVQYAIIIWSRTDLLNIRLDFWSSIFMGKACHN